MGIKYLFDKFKIEVDKFSEEQLNNVLDKIINNINTNINSSINDIKISIKNITYFICNWYRLFIINNFSIGGNYSCCL